MRRFHGTKTSDTDVKPDVVCIGVHGVREIAALEASTAQDMERQRRSQHGRNGMEKEA